MANPEGALHAFDGYTPTDCLDVVAMKVEGTTSSWVNVTLQNVVAGHKLVFHTWANLKK